MNLFFDKEIIIKIIYLFLRDKSKIKAYKKIISIFSLTSILFIKLLLKIIYYFGNNKEQKKTA